MASRGQWIAVGLIVAALGAAVVAGMSLSPDIRPIRPGSEAPAFEAVNVVTGDTIALRDYAGEVMLLNLWATWCPPCEQEMPAMQRLHELLGPRGLKIVAVSVDALEPGQVLEWAQQRGLTFDILHDRTGRVERTYQTTGLPESFIVDRNGVIIRKEISSREWDDQTYLDIFTRLLDSVDDNSETP
ncbi:MAG: TlpA family protein disulfide reductase [Gemmatimonadota bacterium]|nr:MAG: TlpA family protein disulfide reductase [Gemmatimonadota bacterium]